jgi:hypothetical protein
MSSASRLCVRPINCSSTFTTQGSFKNGILLKAIFCTRSVLFRAANHPEALFGADRRAACETVIIIGRQSLLLQLNSTCRKLALLTDRQTAVNIIIV